MTQRAEGVKPSDLHDIWCSLRLQRQSDVALNGGTETHKDVSHDKPLDETIRVGPPGAILYKAAHCHTGDDSVGGEVRGRLKSIIKSNAKRDFADE